MMSDNFALQIARSRHTGWDWELDGSILKGTRGTRTVETSAEDPTGDFVERLDSLCGKPVWLGSVLDMPFGYQAPGQGYDGPPL